MQVHQLKEENEALKAEIQSLKRLQEEHSYLTGKHLIAEAICLLILQFTYDALRHINYMQVSTTCWFCSS